MNMSFLLGHRPYGRIEAGGGEHVRTMFLHVASLPLIPTHSQWMMGGQPLAIPHYGPSVLAAYLRWWPAAIAIVVAARVRPAIAVPLVAAMIAISAAAWVWGLRLRGGPLAQRRRDFYRLAFGTRCDPEAMSPRVRAQLYIALAARWRHRHTTRTPFEVARTGPTSAAEAVLAFGLLHLRALETGARADRDDATRILLGAHERAGGPHDPYRAVAVIDPANLFATVAVAAAAGRDLGFGPTSTEVEEIAVYQMASPPPTRPRPPTAHELRLAQYTAVRHAHENLVAAGILAAVGLVGSVLALPAAKLESVLMALAFVGGALGLGWDALRARRRARATLDELDAAESAHLN